jgi:hypothetical protein
MVAMAVAQNHRIDAADAGHVRQSAGRRTFAEVEQKPPAACFDQEAGRALLADAGNEPQRCFTHCSAIRNSCRH